MASSLTVDEFIRCLELSGILSNEAVAGLLRIVDVEEAKFQRAEDVANYLIRAGILSAWQAEKLLDGKHKGFSLGNYILLDLLGQGAMGTVYLAEQTLMKRRCAVKLLHPTRLKDPQLLDRFLREGRAVASTDHPNIVRAYELSRVREGNTDLYFLAMELATGRDLQTLVQQDGLLEPQRAAQLIRQVAFGLAHAHSKGLIHRDIKPTNLMLDDKGLVKILDLGLARFFDDSDESQLNSLHDSAFLGTAGFLAPEQAMNSRDVDARADLYSVGATAYYLLCGRPPFDEGTIVRRLLESQMKLPTPPQEIRPEIPDELNAIVVKLLQPSLAERFQSAAELIDAINQWLQDAPPNWDHGNSEDSTWRVRAAAAPETVTVPGKLTVRNSSDITTSVSNKAAPQSTTSNSDTGSSIIDIPSGLSEPSLAATAKQNPTSQRSFAWQRTLIGLTLLMVIVWIVLWSGSVTSTPQGPTRNGAEPTNNALESSLNGNALPQEGADPDQNQQRRDSVNPSAQVGIKPSPLAATSAMSVAPRPRTDLGPSPFDMLAGSKIQAGELARAEQDAGGSLPGLVGIIGDGRLNHWGRVLRVAFHPSAKLVASLGNDGTVRVWDLQTSNAVLTIETSRTASAESVAFALGGTRLLVGESSGSVTSYDTTDGRVVWSRHLRTSSIVDLIPVQVGEAIWMAELNSTRASLFNAASGEVTRTIEFDSNIRRLRMSPDESLLAAALSNKQIEIVDSQTGTSHSQLAGHAHPAAAMDFNADNTQLASVSASDRELVVWTLNKPTDKVRIELKDEPHAVAFTASQQVMLANGWSLQSFELRNSKLIKTHYAHYGMVRDIVVSATHSMVATVGDDHQISLWHTPKFMRAFGPESPNHSMRDFGMSPNGDILVAADYWHARQWDGSSGRLTNQLGPYSSVMDHVAVRPDGQHICGASIFEPELRFWHAVTGEDLGRLKLKGALTGLAYSPDAQRLAYGFQSRGSTASMGVTIANAETREPLVELDGVQGDGLVSKLAWNQDGTRLLSCGQRTVALWNAASGRMLKQLKVDNLQTLRFRASVLNDNATRAYVATNDGRVMECDFTQDSVRLFLQLPQSIWFDSLAISPDKTHLLAAAKDGSLHLKSLISEDAPIRKVRIGPARGMAYRAFYTDDGRFIVTGNGNGTIYVFKVEDMVWK